MPSICEITAQVQAIVALDNSAQLFDGSIKELKVISTELCCPLCRLLKLNADDMMLHLLLCSGGGQSAVRNYQRYRLAPAKVMELFKKAQVAQSRFLLVPVKGLVANHVGFPVTSCLAHLVLGGASFSTAPNGSNSYEVNLKNQSLYLNVAKYIENQLIMKESPIDF